MTLSGGKKVIGAAKEKKDKRNSRKKKKNHRNIKKMLDTKDDSSHMNQKHIISLSLTHIHTQKQAEGKKYKE